MKELNPQLLELLKEICAAGLVLLGWYLGRLSVRTDVKRQEKDQI